MPAGPVHTAVPASAHGNPTIPRILLGAQLRRLRKAAGISREEAGYAIRGSDSKISRMELGRVGLKPRDVADLLTLYGVREAAERAMLLALTDQANAQSWWQTYADVVPAWFEAYLGMEDAASVLRCYHTRLVPGLFQTEDYARAVIGAGTRWHPPRRSSAGWRCACAGPASSAARVRPRSGRSSTRPCCAARRAAGT